MLRRTRRIDSDDELDITPMIDVTFLLLIFFMVTSTMQSTPDLPLPPARHGEGIDQQRATIITLAEQNGRPVIYLADGLSGPEADVGEVEKYVADGVEARKATVIIKASRDLPAGFVQDVAKAAKAVGDVETFYLGVRDRED